MATEVNTEMLWRAANERRICLYTPEGQTTACRAVVQTVNDSAGIVDAVIELVDPEYADHKPITLSVDALQHLIVTQERYRDPAGSTQQ